MKELFQTFSKGSEISIFLEKNDNGENTKIIKVANTHNGIKYIENEKKGWDWYSERNETVKDVILEFIIEPEREYARIALKHFNGRKPNYRKGLLRNMRIFTKVLEHYAMIWYKKSDSYPVHGDLSLDNILIHDNHVLIYDWEHFIPDGGPWGFDAFHLIFESLWFEMRLSKISKENLSALLDLIQKLYSLSPAGECQTRAPLREVIAFIHTNKSSWGMHLQALSEKFPVLRFTDDEVYYIDDLILHMMEHH